MLDFAFVLIVVLFFLAAYQFVLGLGALASSDYVRAVK